MDLNEIHGQTPSRRTLTKGAVWAAPALTLAAAAPAQGASAPPTVTKNLFFGVGFNKTTGASAGDGLHTACARPGTLPSDNNYGFGAASSKASGNQICVSHVPDASKIGTVTVSLWFGYISNGITWSATSASYTGWSLPASTGASISTTNGSIYQYTTSLTTTASMWASDGSGGQCLDMGTYGYDFLSQCFDQTAQSRKLFFAKDDNKTDAFRSDVTVTVNGQAYSVIGAGGTLTPRS